MQTHKWRQHVRKKEKGIFLILAYFQSTYITSKHLEEKRL